MAQYNSIEYWNDRYRRDGEEFEWYQSFKELKPLLSKMVGKHSKVLNIGCGNSRKFVLVDACIKMNTAFSLFSSFFCNFENRSLLTS